MPRNSRRRTLQRIVVCAFGAGLVMSALAAAVDDGWHLAHGTVPFDLGGNDADVAQGVTVLDDGRILLAGTVANGSVTTAALVRLLPNGNTDPTFGGGTGRVVNPCSLFVASSASAVHLLPDGRILLAGSLLYGGSGDFLVWRLLPDGSCDDSFGQFGTRVIAFDLGGANLDEVTALVVDPVEETIVVVGAAGYPGSDIDFGVARLMPNGDLDTTFSGDGKTTIAIDFAGADPDLAHAVAIDRLGRILVGGAAWNRNGGAYEFALVRLLTDGSSDASFGSAGVLAWGYNAGGSNNELIRGVAIWPDGEIVAVGELGTAAAGQEWVVLRIGPNGIPVIGVTHGSFGGGPAAAKAVLLQGDGKILIAGFGMVSASFDFGIARLLRDGNLDPAFGFGWGFTSYNFNWGAGTDVDAANAVALDRDGRIVAAGYAEFNDPDFDFAWLRLESSYIFADGFDWPGGWARWSSVVP